MEKTIGFDDILNTDNNFVSEEQKKQNQWINHEYLKYQDFNLLRKKYFEIKNKYESSIILVFVKAIIMEFITKYISYNSNINFNLINECFSCEKYEVFVEKINKLLETNASLEKIIESNGLICSYYKLDQINLSKIYQEILSIIIGIKLFNSDEDKLVNWTHRNWCKIYCTQDINLDVNILDLDIEFNLLDDFNKQLIKEKIAIVQNFILID